MEHMALPSSFLFSCASTEIVKKWVLSESQPLWQVASASSKGEWHIEQQEWVLKEMSFYRDIIDVVGRCMPTRSSRSFTACLVRLWRSAYFIINRQLSHVDSLVPS